jgi:lipopolysaccharide export system protein LptA
MKLNKYALGCCLWLLVQLAVALKSDESKPVNITANSWTGDQLNKILTFSGNVVATRGSMIVNAATAQVTQDQQGNKRIHLIGAPITFSQLNDDGEKTEGQCNDFVYDTAKNLAILTGRARVKKGDNLVMGDKLTYNTKTQIYSAMANDANGISSNKKGRVTVILQPNQKGSNGNTNSINLQ